MQSGFILIDKPIDWTSHDVVGYIRNIVRRSTGQKKIRVGHAGTLDPFATGLLIIGIGRDATKRIDKFKNLKKTYETSIQLGAISDTHDKTGTITLDNPLTPLPDEKHIKKILQSFMGTQMQIPPMYSAKKVGGKKLYELARKGIKIERQPHEIKIYNIKLLDFHNNTLHITCDVSAGTYIRTLAFDIGKKLNIGAYCEELRRTYIGNYSVKNTPRPKDITQTNWTSYLFNITTPN